MFLRSVDAPVPVRLVRPLLALAAGLVIVIVAIAPVLARPESGASADVASANPDHLVLSEVMTGGASASDEFVELYNPASTALAIEGLELIYVSASGATITRKAGWDAGAPPVEPGAHLLIANAAGIYAAIADVTYANGLAAAGGSVALRVPAATLAIDAVGWGTAASTWMEGQPAPAPSAGSSLERLPGGSAGSGQDTQDNLVDFFVQPVPDPQNSDSPPIPVASQSPLPSASPAPTGTPSGSPTPSPTVIPTPSPTPSPSRAPIPIADARALPDGSQATIAGVALSGSDFTEGGGYVADATGGIAVLMSDGAFARGAPLTVTGTIDDRYSQRTLRAGGSDLSVTGGGGDPQALITATGAVGESAEALLVRIEGEVVGPPTELSAGLAYDVDDGSGPVRVLVGAQTGIDTSGWAKGSFLTVVGIVGQRDSSGTGSGGYRVQPRDPGDIVAMEPPASPSPSPTQSDSASPAASATPIPSDELMSINQARLAATGTHLRVRGVVTVASGLIEPGSAIVQDASAGILVRLDDDAGTLQRGQFVELDGTRSTRAGMLTLRVETVPLILGQQAEPAALRVATGLVSETHEAELVIVRGAISSTPVRSTANNVSFTIDDGSGKVRIVLLARSGIGSAGLARDVWIEVRGAVGQETTGALPDRGYRVWPRSAGDLTIVARPDAAGVGAAANPGAAEPGGGLIGGRNGGRTPDLGAAGPGDASEGVRPGLGGGASRPGEGGGDGTEPIVDAMLASLPRDLARRQVGALALASLALVVLVASAAWWNGAFRRLRDRLFGSRSSAELDAAAVVGATLPDAGTEAALAPLTVLSDLRERDGP